MLPRARRAAARRAALSLLVPLILVLGLTSPAAVPTAAAPPAATAIGAAFAAFRAAHGGDLVFGAPLTGEINAGALTMQYYERARLEWHSDWPAGAQITLGRLGAEVLGDRHFAPVAAFPSNPGHRYFALTGHSVQGEILRFWETHGGIPIFGYPLSEELTEDGLTVQYFERARLEWHPELGGTGYGVLPSPLGILRAPKPDPAVIVEPPVVQTGHTYVIAVPVPPGARVSGTLDGHSLTFNCCRSWAPAGARMQIAWALGGVEPELSAAPQSLAVTISQPDAVVQRAQRTVPTVDYTFPLIREPYPYAQPPPTSGQSSNEEALIARIVAGRSGPPQWSGPWRAPLDGPLTVNAAFGERRAYGSAPVSVIHGGVDLNADTGQPIYAPAAGTVVLAQTLVERGNAIILDHGDGVFTLYGHLSAWRVTEGQHVRQGDVIGLIGSTGLATGPHLHWEVHVSGTYVEPLQWLRRAFP